MKTDNWIMVYSSPFLYQVEMMKIKLEEENINSVIINNKDSSYLFGEIELYVNSIDFIRAKAIVSKINKND
ncbi:MAG TPA: DUF2007 domain-containing protein [Bacteroidales bacterium]|nr:DUF2007 domain-containing protein [Bacteroidales bacterium]